jgi:hypothetical protein
MFVANSSILTPIGITDISPLDDVYVGIEIYYLCNVIGV